MSVVDHRVLSTCRRILAGEAGLVLASCILGVGVLTAGARGQEELASVLGNNAGARLGDDVDAFGDLNGDGLADVLVGSSRDETEAVWGGRAVVFSGADGSVLWETFGDALDELGREVAGLGDVDGDGYPDAAVRQYGKLTPEDPFGQVFVYSPHDDSILYHFLPGPDDVVYLGSLAGVGDTNNDGFNDILVGVRTVGDFAQPGQARLHSGADGSILHTFIGTDGGDDFGNASDGAGDVNGDGFVDVIVGAPGASDLETNGGKTWVFSGQDHSVLMELPGGVYLGQAGFSVAGLGDLDDDGFDDVGLGIPHHIETQFSGSLEVWSGQHTELLFRYKGDTDEGRLGVALGGGGDVNGDGVPDLVAGASFAQVPEAGQPGKAHVVSGADGTTLFKTRGMTSSSKHGFRCDILGDGDGDGYADVAVGAYQDDTAGLDAGELRILGGTPWVALGGALAGAGHDLPQLAGSGPLTAGELFGLTMEDGLPGATAFLVLGFTELDAPFKGGRLVPSPDVVVPLVLDGAGGFVFQAPWPAGIPVASSAWFQVWIVDAAGPAGFTATNAVRATTPVFGS